LHLRLNEKTFGIVTERDILLIKENAALIKTVRAKLIEKGKLLKCLTIGKPTYVGLDVYEEVPIFVKNFDFLKLPNVVCTPHLGYVERNGFELYFAKAFENAMNYINVKPTNIVNPDVL